MSEIHIRRTHRLAESEAQAAVERVAAELKRKHALDWRWQEERILFARGAVSGQLFNEEDIVEIRLTLDTLLDAHRAQLESELHASLEAAFGEA
jgi:putative polyhydroxyalkanoate system protein